MNSKIKIGHLIKCKKILNAYCNGVEKTIFTKNKVYEVKNSFNNPYITIRDNSDGFTFFNDNYDSYFEIVGFANDLMSKK